MLYSSFPEANFGNEMVDAKLGAAVYPPIKKIAGETNLKYQLRPYCGIASALQTSSGFNGNSRWVDIYVDKLL